MSMILFIHQPQDNSENIRLAEQQHRDELTRQRMFYIQERQAAIDALTPEQRQEYDEAMAALKKSFLAIVRLETQCGQEGKPQALAVRFLSNMMPGDVVAIYHKEMPTYKKMQLLANKQLLLDQKHAKEQDPAFCDSSPSPLGLQECMTHLSAQRAVKDKLQNFPDRKAYVAAYHKVDQEMHNLVTPPYNSPYYNLDKLRRMQDGLDSIPPETLVKWTDRYPIDDVDGPRNIK